MARDYLDDLALTTEERARLRSLGADDPAALLAMYDAEPAAFERYLGPSTARAVATLRALAPVHAGDAATPTMRLDAQLGSAPPLPPPAVDLSLRDQLYEALERLRRHPPSPERDRATAALEARINALLDR